MPGILEDKDRIFTNLYGFHDPYLEGAEASAARGTPPATSCRAAATGSSPT